MGFWEAVGVVGEVEVVVVVVVAMQEVAVVMEEVMVAMQERRRRRKMRFMTSRQSVVHAYLQVLFACTQMRGI